ncbi:MAG: beta-galactosidase family protein [Bacteroidales bacterium]
MFNRSTVFILLCLSLSASSLGAQKAKHTFKFSQTEFLLDGKPFQIISGEIHPARIPENCWKHRIEMAKAMGCNTISAYIFWNYHEQEEGIFDFTSDNHNISEFIKIVQDEGMWLILRPGPYVCAEWDLGGIPPYLLRIPDIKLRCLDERYMAAVGRYIARLAEEIRPFQITKGGPLLLIQIENEYGSYSNDHDYMKKIRDLWKASGIEVPSFTCDGPSTKMLEAGTLPGSAVGLDSGTSDADFALATKMNPGVPVFSSEIYPGWLTHWGEAWAKPDTGELLKEVKYLMDNKKSFNLYVIHGGTNFGFTAGANSGDNGYEPDVTSYDYDAPVNEEGMATPKYLALRRLIGSYLPKKQKLPPIPAPMKNGDIPALPVDRFTSIWDYLPEPVSSEKPGTFESYGLDYGFILYRTVLQDYRKGILTVTDIHDYATVFLNGEYVGNLDRRAGINSIDLPDCKVNNPQLEILVEGMGRINYGKDIVDRKGITEKVTLNGNTLLNWKIYKLPLDSKFIYNLRSSGKGLNKPGIFFRSTVSLAFAIDTYFDMSSYKKGIVWVNGHNLGRYWDIGPQKRLYCPAAFLKPGFNEIIIFDLHSTEAKPISGFATAE